MAQFNITGCNYIGTPEGYITLNAGEKITDITLLSQCRWERDNVDSEVPDDAYIVTAWDTGWSMALLPGNSRKHRTLWSGKTYNARRLAGYYFNGVFQHDTDWRDSEQVDPDILEQRERDFEQWKIDFNRQCFESGSMGLWLAEQYAARHGLELPAVYEQQRVTVEHDEYFEDEDVEEYV